MPKRASDNSLEFIARKLRKLEKEVKRSRRKPHNRFSLSSSSSALSRSTSPSSSSSRPPSTNPDNQEATANPNSQIDATNIEQPVVENNDTTHITISDTSPEIAPSSHEDAADDNNAKLLDILGADPSVTIEFGPEINKDVASRFAYIATTGLNKEVRKDLLKKYIVPENCKNIAAPLLNAEIKAALTDQVLKRDKAIESRQKQMAAAISSLGKIISGQLCAIDKNSELIKDLMDVGRIFCDIQHAESEARRNFALYSVKKELKDQLSMTKIDKYLFGNNLAETLKTAKAVSKSSSGLKPDAPKKPKPTSTSASTSSKNLNWKARTPARRQPMVLPPRQQPPATQSAPPRVPLSHNYTQRPKQIRRQ